MGEIRILTREKEKDRQMDKQTKKKVREIMRKRKRREGRSEKGGRVVFHNKKYFYKKFVCLGTLFALFIKKDRKKER